MIKNILIPEDIQGYYLFPKTVVAIALDKTCVTATVLSFRARERSIVKCIYESIEAQNQQENVVEALTRVKNQCGAYDLLISVLPSASVMYKELNVPLTNAEQIRLILPYEIEPSLPFPLQDTTIDFIITKSVPGESRSEILVAATPNTYLNQHVELLKQADLNPTIVTLDMLSIYSLVHDDAVLLGEGTTIICDIHMTYINIGYVAQGQLRSIRSLPGGIQSLVKIIAAETNTSATQVLENLLRYGFEHSETNHFASTAVLKKAFSAFWADSNLTISSFTQKKNVSSKGLIVQSNVQIKGIETYIAQQSPIAWEIINTEAVTQHNNLKNPTNQHVTPDMIIPLGAALQKPIIESFNLLNKAARESAQKIFFKQIMVAGVLSLLSLALFTGYAFWASHGVQRELSENEAEIVETLKEQLPSMEIEPNEPLDETIEQAEKAVKREESTWFAFSEQARTSFLEYLLELTNRVDKDALGFKIQSLNMKPRHITLKAQVRDHDALRVLERDLKQSPLFSYVEPQSDTNFTMKITVRDKK